MYINTDLIFVDCSDCTDQCFEIISSSRSIYAVRWEEGSGNASCIGFVEDEKLLKSGSLAMNMYKPWMMQMDKMEGEILVIDMKHLWKTIITSLAHSLLVLFEVLQIGTLIFSREDVFFFENSRTSQDNLYIISGLLCFGN